MPAPLALSLAFHLAALGLPMWVPTPTPPTPPVQVRLEWVPEPPPVSEAPKPKPLPTPRPTSRQMVAAPQALLAGGGAMSDEFDDVSAQATPAAARSALAEAPSAGVNSSASPVVAGTWSADAGGAQSSVTGQTGPGPARMLEAAGTRASTTPATGGGQAGVGDMSSGTLRAEGRTAAAVLARPSSGAVSEKASSGAPASGDGGSSAAARGGASAATPHLRTAAAGSAVASEAGPEARASGVDAGTTQRLSRAHAQAATARMADAGAAGRQPASASPGLPGAVASAESAAQRHGGPERRPAGLAAIEGAQALDPSALALAPSNLVFRAALAGDGEACFGYSSALRRSGLQGLVVLRVRVDVAGRPQRIEIRRSSGMARLDAHAKDQAERCARFVVHNRKGQAVAATLDLPVRYRFNED